MDINRDWPDINRDWPDINRDWPDIGFSFRPYSGLSEPESRALSSYGDVKAATGKQFAAGDDLHGQPFADALSYTLLPHGKHDYAKDPPVRRGQVRFKAAGGRVAGSSINSGAGDASAVFSRVTLGEIPLGAGKIRVAGTLLPQASKEFDHTLGLEPYAVTYTGYILARNLLLP